MAMMTDLARHGPYPSLTTRDPFLIGTILVSALSKACAGCLTAAEPYHASASPHPGHDQFRPLR